MAIDPDDGLALTAIASAPSFGVVEFLRKIKRGRDVLSVDLLSQAMAPEAGLPARVVEVLYDLVVLADELPQKGHELSPVPFVEYALERTGYARWLTSVGRARDLADHARRVRDIASQSQTLADFVQAMQGQANQYRLAVRTIPLSESVSDTISAIVPARAMALLARTASAQEAPISIHVTPSKSQVVFHLESVELVSQLLDGNFPDYDQIVPKKKDIRVVARTAEVLKACKAANVFARDSKGSMRLTISPGTDLEPGSITVQAASAETGDNVTKLDVGVEGPAIQVALNVTYVTDGVEAVGTEQVAIEATTPNSPVVFRPVGQDGYFCVVMPMQLR